MVKYPFNGTWPGGPPRSFTYDDTGVTPHEHIVCSEGGDIYMALIGVVGGLKPSPLAEIMLHPWDLDTLISLYLDDPIRTKVTTHNNFIYFMGVRCKTIDTRKPQGWWPG